ncbi:MAG: hypothetical protein C4538_01545 [Nitrospiraceae bacterium]|nr:MAG: hypothetical protein C4538_01545 [Nitrospiraceae bacterium]
MQKRDFPWYEIVDNKEPVLQGDFFLSCPVFIPTTASLFKEDESPTGDIDEYDVIVMSQSCDLVLKKLDLVLVCPIWSLGDLEKENDFFKKLEGKEALRQGNVPGYHLLNKCGIDDFEREYAVVDFRQSYSLPFNLVIDIAQRQDKRLRLLPPYREHLSQAYARFFMRVGLPIDIPRFK